MARPKRKDKTRTVLRTGELQRSDGSYQYSWTDENHKRRYVYSKTLEALRIKEEAIEKDKSDGIKAEARYVTLDDLYELWKDLKRGLKNNTFENYKYIYETFVRRQIGSKRVSTFLKSDIKRFYNYLVDERGLKPATVDGVHNILHQIFDMAVDDNYIRTNVQNAYQMIIRSVVRAPLMMICSITMCVIISPRLSIIFLVALIFLGFVLFFIIYKVTPVFTSGFEKYDELNASVQENISGIRVVKAFVREEHENKKFNKAADNLYKTFVKAESFLAFNNPTMMLVVYGCIVALSWFASHFIVSGSITTGNLTSMFSYVMNMLMALMILSMIFVMVSMSAASARRISEVLNEKADLANPEKPYEEVEDGRIDFNHVNFSYRKNSTEDTLHDIDIHINAGETIGIIGGTGCGKSSFVSLISRLYDVTEGSVCVGGKDVRTYDMDALRNQVAVVLQKNVLFSGTILDNLRWGDDNASYEDCVEACKQACADEFIERMPKKYDTWIEQGGTNVSGGQRQRLCIARALLKKPKVLILDDSTSAVDTATDAKIKQAFAQKIPGTTKLIVSQRISSIQDADRIIVLEDGKVSGFDTHENLMENNKVYREICEVQMQGGGDFDESAE